MENMVDIVFLKQNAFILPPPMKAHELLSSPETWCQESPAEDPKFCGHNVLVVDDDNGVCRVIQRMLSDGSFKVQISHCVADALEAIDQRPFDAYVMDFNLGDGSGLEVAEWIRSKGSEVPIILISGCNADYVASRAEKIRISEFLEKPFSGDTICNAVKKAIGSENLTTHGKSR